jgi:hypothetical protein
MHSSKITMFEFKKRRDTLININRRGEMINFVVKNTSPGPISSTVIVNHQAKNIESATRAQSKLSVPPSLPELALLLPTEALLCGSSPVVKRLELGSEDEVMCAVLLKAPGRAAALLLPKVCQLRPSVMDRDSFVRLFYYSILPAILASRQSSWLLLRVQNGNPQIAVWEQESSPMMKPPHVDTRVMVPDVEARRLLERHATKRETSYALRIVVERKGSAHALIALISKNQAVLVDPNGSLQQVSLCLGDSEVLLSLLRNILTPLGCHLTVSPITPPLHSISHSLFDQSYLSGGACTLSSGAVALRALLQGLTPMASLNELMAISHTDRTRAVTSTVDSLIALTLACHLTRTIRSEEEGRDIIMCVVDQLSSGRGNSAPSIKSFKQRRP